MSLDHAIEQVKLARQDIKDGLRHPTDEELIDEAAKACQRASAICRELKPVIPAKFDAEIEQNIDLLHDVLNNFAAMRMGYDLARYRGEL